MGICSDSALMKTVKSQWLPCPARGHSDRGGRRLPRWIWDPGPAAASTFRQSTQKS